VVVAEPVVDVLGALRDPGDREQAAVFEFVPSAGSCVMGEPVALTAVPKQMPRYFVAAEVLA
jgi:hypothetical protein